MMQFTSAEIVLTFHSLRTHKMDPSPLNIWYDLILFFDIFAKNLTFNSVEWLVGRLSRLLGVAENVRRFLDLLIDLIRLVIRILALFTV